MPYQAFLPEKNEYGDNGWFTGGNSSVAHYVVKQLPVCGSHVFSKGLTMLEPRTKNDRCCKMCSKVRRNQLRARMNFWSEMRLAKDNALIVPKSHSPRKPQ